MLGVESAVSSAVSATVLLWGDSRVTDLIFAGDAVLAETTEILVMTLEVLHEEAKPFQLSVCQTEKKCQALKRLLDDITFCSCMCMW